MIIHDHEQGSAEWYAARAGRPTASEAEKLITNTGLVSKQMQAYAEKLAGDIVAGKPIDAWQGNAFTEHGHEIEAEARDWYSFTQSVEVVQVGFVTDDLLRYGCSPDGMVGEDGLVELKCLPRQHIKALMHWHKNKTAPTEYTAQCQMQLLVTDRLWVDRVYYHPDLPSIVIRIERDQKMIDALQKQITACITYRDEVVKALQELAA